MEYFVLLCLGKAQMICAMKIEKRMEKAKCG